MIFFRIDYKFTDSIILTKEEIEHLRSLRLNQIDKIIEFRNGKGNSFFYEILSKENKGKLVESKTIELKNTNISIATAIPKNHRLDFLLQKCTEIGIDNFYFINFFQSDRQEINLERSMKIILEACSQSKRDTVPKIKIYSSLEKYIFAHPNSFLLNPLAEKKLSQNDNWDFIPIIGPEGGFRKEEIEITSKNSLPEFQIGKNILKIETAAVYLCSIIQFKNF